ncbi:MAG: type II toxin-antitoxin system RelE/ParE family toxin [Chitinophagaceae bacterium]|nr:type II toxin-antitoxin system RelE/ParE family toxin [Chitinophagaceae bacterium]
MVLKGKTVIVSPQAEEDLKDLYEYLFTEFGKETLEKFHQKWLDFLKVVSCHPRLFPLLHKRKNLRKHAIHERTMVVYKPTRTAIEIVTLFNTRQNPKSLKKVIRKY